ncbi:MAG: hypothetical protein ACI9VS_000951 [Candidatus Binatia bacterium]|jgi:hypothetical protein
MQEVLCHNIWKRVGSLARKARRRKAAIAYVTKDLIGFRRNDMLVVDASENAVKSGETDARLLRDLLKRGVQIFSCDSLHAKLLWFDQKALVGSGNLSRSSEQTLVEAGVLNDHPGTAASVESLIEQLIQQSPKLEARDISRLCRIEVLRRGRGRLSSSNQGKKPSVAELGNRVWLISVRELLRDPSESDQTQIDEAVEELRSSGNTAGSEVGWIRWSGGSRFVRECREGDLVIRIWRSNKAKQPGRVCPATPVLLKQRAGRGMRFFVSESIASPKHLAWGQFKRLLRECGFAPKVGSHTARELDQDLADPLAETSSCSQLEGGAYLPGRPRGGLRAPLYCLFIMSRGLTECLTDRLPATKSGDFLFGKGRGNEIPRHLLKYRPVVKLRVRERIGFLVCHTSINHNRRTKSRWVIMTGGMANQFRPTRPCFTRHHQNSTTQS